MITSGQDAEIKVIKKALAHGKLVPVIGAGVSTATAGLPSWTGIVESALKHAEHTSYGTNSDKIAEAKVLLKQGDLARAAHIAKKLLGAPLGEYPAWLKELFDVSGKEVRSRRVTQRIFDLRAPLLATTNYDKILSNENIAPVTAISWLHPVKMQAALKGKGHILHLHGIYDEPSSAIFGADDYETIVSDAAYQSVLRVLWLDRTLLFIGCSFDGLDDPDFNSLLNWASRTFKGSTDKHFALMREGSFDVKRAANLLRTYRIQIITYGPNFDDLPEALKQLNGDPQASVKLRLELACKILDLNDQSKSDELERVLKGLTWSEEDNPQNQKDFSILATNLFNAQKSSVKRHRENLTSFQSVAETLIDTKQLAELNDRWFQRKITTYEGPFQEAVDRAFILLKLLSSSFLTELCQRGVGIHPYWMNGYLQSEYRFLEIPTLADAYGIENANRILSTLRAIVQADASKVFPEPLLGVSTIELKGKHVLVTRSGHLELRSFSAPQKVAAALPIGLPSPRRAQAVKIHEKVTIAVFDDQRIFLWDPRRASTAYEEWRPPQELEESINDVAHQQTAEGLRTVVCLDAGSIIELGDLEFRIQYNIDYRISSPVCLVQCPKEFFVLTDGFDASSIARVKQDGTKSVLFTKKEFRELAMTHPIASVLFNQKQSIDADAGISRGLDSQFQHMSLKKGHLGAREILIVRIKIWFARSAADDFLIFIDPAEKDILKGCLYLKDACTIAFGEQDGDSQVIGLLHTHGTQDSLVWAKPLSTPQGLIFTRCKSAWQHERDVISLVIDSQYGFVSDDLGALYKIDLEHMIVSAVAADRNSSIRDLKIMEF